MILKVLYDADVDAASIDLVAPHEGMIERTIEAVDQTILLHFDKQDHLVSIEVLRAKSVLPSETLRAACRR